jgi:uncharacterized membrane protein YraQ (UPF0718 family)
MAENLPAASFAGRRRFSPRAIISILLLVGLVAGLIGYKANGGLKRFNQLRATGSLPIHTEALHRPAGSSLVATGAQTLAYLNIVWPALVFGVLISAAVHAAISPRRLATLFGQGLVKPQLAAAAAGAPLMLCSCCVAPMFPAVYRRSQRLGPSLAFTLAAPALNPAALTFSFLLFPLAIAGTRLAMALVLVVLASALVARIAGPVQVRTAAVEDFAETGDGLGDFIQAYFRSLWYITVRTVPWILLGIWVSMIIANRIPIQALASGRPKVLILLVVATGAVLLTLPTFFEIPLALSLLAAGAPAGIALAVLIAGPSINLASLLVIARYSHWKVAALTAAAVWVAAVAGGLLIG